VTLDASVSSARRCPADFLPKLFHTSSAFVIAIYLTPALRRLHLRSGWRRGQARHYQRLAFAVRFTIAALWHGRGVVAICQPGLVSDSPPKFAAMEINWNTRCTFRDHRRLLTDSGRL